MIVSDIDDDDDDANDDDGGDDECDDSDYYHGIDYYNNNHNVSEARTSLITQSFLIVRPVDNVTEIFTI
jgi:hypothetical protein